MKTKFFAIILLLSVSSYADSVNDLPVLAQEMNDFFKLGITAQKALLKFDEPRYARLVYSEIDSTGYIVSKKSFVLNSPSKEFTITIFRKTKNLSSEPDRLLLYEVRGADQSIGSSSQVVFPPNDGIGKGGLGILDEAYGYRERAYLKDKVVYTVSIKLETGISKFEENK